LENIIATKNHGSQQVQVASDILVENISHMSTPHQSPLQTILVLNAIDCYSFKSFSI
jgi:hypothetical protein